MLFRIPLFNAVAAVGDFLLVVRSRDADYPSVCVIREVACNEIRVTWWLTLEELSELNIKAPPPLPFTSYGNVLKCRLKEVVEDCSTIGAINACDVRDIAFVFHVKENDFVNCAGMSRVFYTRYRLQNGVLSAIDYNLFLPFSRVCVESYPSRLWYFILVVKSVVDKLFHDPKQYQSCKKMAVMACSFECWTYLCFCFANSDAAFFSLTRNHTEKNIHCDLSLSSSRTKKVLHFIRIDTELSLNVAHNLFGITFGLGVRNRAPRKGEQPVTMHHGDGVNMIDITRNDPVDCNGL
jgi:hypothetical protein